MLHFAVVDDREEDFLIMKECIDFFSETVKEEISVSYFKDPITFLSAYSGDFDVILMDIEMPKMNGIDVIRKIRVTDSIVPVMFVTNMAQYVFQGYEVNAIDYIVKPIDKFGFLLKMKRALERSEGLSRNSIVVRTDGAIRKIETREIKYFEVQGHYVVIHTISEDIKIYSTLKVFESQLGEGHFYYCSRFCLVNLKYVDKIEKDRVFICGVEGGNSLFLSRYQKTSFIKAFSQYLGRGTGIV